MRCASRKRQTGTGGRPCRLGWLQTVAPLRGSTRPTTVRCGVTRFQPQGFLERGEPGERIIVNVQGDEPLISPRVVSQVAELLDSRADADMATLCEPIDTVEDLLDAVFPGNPCWTSAVSRCCNMSMNVPS